ncbi:unnamed protein product [Prorocentrum cordatum]|uniref:Uncharacterized protein n=1 Tax=Prorocentrum cordatum TaxID=2364126 RepID=A0ABN9UA91_9DINO|nr:unnamed protein product [Polarella glacialis]
MGNCGKWGGDTNPNNADKYGESLNLCVYLFVCPRAPLGEGGIGPRAAAAGAVATGDVGGDVLLAGLPWRGPGGSRELDPDHEKSEELHGLEKQGARNRAWSRCPALWTPADCRLVEWTVAERRARSAPRGLRFRLAERVSRAAELPAPSLATGARWWKGFKELVGRNIDEVAAQVGGEVHGGVAAQGVEAET